MPHFKQWNSIFKAHTNTGPWGTTSDHTWIFLRKCSWKRVYRHYGVQQSCPRERAKAHHLFLSRFDEPFQSSHCEIAFTMQKYFPASHIKLAKPRRSAAKRCWACTSYTPKLTGSGQLVVYFQRTWLSRCGTTRNSQWPSSPAPDPNPTKDQPFAISPAIIRFIGSTRSEEWGVGKQGRRGIHRLFAELLGPPTKQRIYI